MDIDAIYGEDQPFLPKSLGHALTSTINCLDKDERFFLTCSKNICKISLTCANCPSSIFRWYSWQTSQFSKIFQTFCEQVRKNLTGQWNLPNIVESRSGKTFPQIDSRMINLPAELGWISENLTLSPRLRLGLQVRFLLTHPRSAGRFIPILGILPNMQLPSHFNHNVWNNHHLPK